MSGAVPVRKLFMRILFAGGNQEVRVLWDE